MKDKSKEPHEGARAADLAVLALAKLQGKMRGEAAKAKSANEDDVADLITASRRKKNEQNEG